MKKIITFIALALVAYTANSQTWSFQDLDDVFLFIMPSKTFDTGSGDLEIKCVEYNEGVEMTMYYRGKYLSKVGWENPNTVAQGSYARLAVRTDRYQVSFILHMPDGSHSKPYLYFEPMPTSTNQELAAALQRGANINVPITNGWMRFQPIVDGSRAGLSFEPSSSKPTPFIYNMK